MCAAPTPTDLATYGPGAVVQSGCSEGAAMGAACVLGCQASADDDKAPHSKGSAALGSFSKFEVRRCEYVAEPRPPRTISEGERPTRRSDAHGSHFDEWHSCCPVLQAGYSKTASAAGTCQADPGKASASFRGQNVACTAAVCAAPTVAAVSPNAIVLSGCSAGACRSC